MSRGKMEPKSDKKDQRSSGCGGRDGVDRREFLRISGAGSLAALAWPLGAMAGPFEISDFEKLVPADKKLSPDWVKSLFERGEPTIYRRDQFKYIGMPVGGICTGQVYLAGDGKLWHWDIFNKPRHTGDSHYANPFGPDSLLEQGFSLQVGAKTYSLDQDGFEDVRFCGQYPIGTVEYRDKTCPVEVKLEAFSPFIPLATDDSSLPATVMQFTLRNTSAKVVEGRLVGRLENAVCLHNRQMAGMRRNNVVRGDGFTLLDCTAQRMPDVERTVRPDIVFEDWSRGDYGDWKVEGAAFGSGPVRKTDFPAYQGDVGGDTEYVVNSHATAPGGDVGAKDAITGKLTSKAFTIERNNINFWIGGGSHENQTCLNLLVDGKIVHSVSGRNDNRMSPQSITVRRFVGRKAVIEIVDAATGGWGNIGVGRIWFSDKLASTVEALEELHDYGSMALALLGKSADYAVADKDSGEQASVSLEEKLVGALGRDLYLKPGESATVAFVVAWCFPNFSLDRLGKVGRHYAARFDSARAVVRYVTDNFERLASQTRLWCDTWYDSTLPYWFLDRTLLNASILASSTCYRFKDGRFYGWEGVGCCPGTCTHVWQYAHSAARLFPELERDTRDRVEFGISLDSQTGRIKFRGEFNDHWAVDGQAGCILRAYREHQMCTDDAFLRGIWPRVKKSLEFLIARDVNKDGIIDGPQHNTLDADWYGEVAWLSGMYVAALRVGERMALEAGDENFAWQCREIAGKGSENIVARLFDGEYFINKPDADHLDAINSGTGCEIDQVLGQSWALQVHLGRIMPEAQTRSALKALWKYNFTPDVGPYRNANKPGRWYAMPGEAGLLMCTFPRQDWNYIKAAGKGPQWAAGYFNECMNGFEYQAAGHMIWEGLVQEGLAVTRAVHDRYHASRRNPWNEIECGDHYARSMASYGIFIAACGYEYHGPKGYLAFAPRLTPNEFKAAFTTAEGWGTFSQKRNAKNQRATIELKWGKLRVRTLCLAISKDTKPKTVTVIVSGRQFKSSFAIQGERVTITFNADLNIQADQKIEVSIL